MAESTNDLVHNTLNSLHESVLTLILSTINQDTGIETSYSPYFFDGNDYYILISNLAPHSQNIKTNPNISFLIIEDETNTKNIYARRRITSQATAKVIERGSEVFEQIIDNLAKRVSKMVYMLAEMNDFNLYKITPTVGRVVIGFGRTFIYNHQTKAITPVDESYLANQKAQQ